MASELAILLAAPSADEDDNPNDDAVEWCDHKLQEVREVLLRLQQSRGCWCVATWKGSHDGRYLRTSALYEKLRTDK